MGRTAAQSDRKRNVVDALNAEWSAMAWGDHDRVVEWAGRHPPLQGCRGLVDVFECLPLSPDRVLGVLLGECSRGDQLAGRMVLQAMLGKVVAMAGRDSQADVDDYVAEMWVRICRYPLGSRPTRIAANLALDTLKHVHRTRPSRRGAEVIPYPSEALAEMLWTDWARLQMHHGNVADLDARQVIAAATRLGLLNDDARAALTLVYDVGLSSRQAAEVLGKSPGMVRQRCSKTLAHLARHAEELADAA